MLLHRKGQFALSTLGIAFSVVIMFMEIGFFNGINDSQARLATHLNGDLVLIHQKRYSLLESDQIHRITMQQALAHDAVIAAAPLYEANALVTDRETGMAQAISVLAFPAYTRPLNVKGLDELEELLAIEGNIAFDRESRDLYGDVTAGGTLSLGNSTYQVVGLVEMGPSLKSDGYIFMGAHTWNKTRAEADLINMAVLTLKAGTDATVVRESLAVKLGPDILIFTPEELRQREVDFTTHSTPVGGVFAIGVLIGFVIGLIICYQILFNEISDNMPQYATVKAVGFPRRYLISLVLQQAVLLAIFGFIPGLASGYTLYQVIESSTSILMFITIERAAFIFVLTLVMCILSGLLAVQKVLQADPADVF